MKKYLLSSLAVIGIVAMTSSASAAFLGVGDSGSYGLLQGSYDFGRNNTGDSGTLGVGGGYQLNDWLRADAIIAYRGWGDIDLKNGGKNDYWSIPLLVNAYATLPVYDGLGVYVMGGLGGSYNKVKSGHGAGGDGKFDFAWNLGAGVEYEFSNCWVADLGYRYTDLGDGKVKPRDGYTGKRSQNITSNDVKLTLRYIF